MNDKYYVYMIRCEDNSLYTGIALDVEKRYLQHKSGKGAKYTRNKKVKKLEISFLCENKSEALKVERYIKKKNKPWKELVITDVSLLEMKIFEELKIKIKKILTHNR